MDKFEYHEYHEYLVSDCKVFYYDNWKGRIVALLGRDYWDRK